MQQAELSVRHLKFGVFEVDLRTGELTKHGRRVRLQDQPFQLLAMLLEKPGTLVTREELHVKLWPETTVDFDHGLNKAISKIREALGDSAENPRFIETVARRGYRFLADVTVVGAAQTEITVVDAAPAKIAADEVAVPQLPDPPQVSQPSARVPAARPARAATLLARGADQSVGLCRHRRAVSFPRRRHQ